MSQIGRTALKAFFETDDVPTEAQFIDLIDSLFDFTDDDSDDLTEGSTKLLLTGAERTKLVNAFIKNVDDSDDITESSDKKFLDGSSEQLIAGNKEFSGQAYASNAAATIKSFTATPEFDFDSGNDQQMTLTGNVTGFTTINEVGSANYKVYLINDGSVRTVVAPTGWTADTTSETHTTAANAVNLYQFYTFPDGTKYFNLHIVKA